MKAVLVIDMPYGCDSCPCLDSELWDCQAKDFREAKYNEKPSWCPLKPLPERKLYYQDNPDDNDYELGFNACIDEITGEKE